MRVLIVDDDAGLRQSLALLLQEAGYEVVTEGDPEQAWRGPWAGPSTRALRRAMPKMDGVTFLRRYRADGGQALMIMMSAYGSEDSALAAMREGAYDYLHKPFRPDEVTMTLRKAEEREKLRREVEVLRTSLGAGAASDWWSARAARCATCSSSPPAWRATARPCCITGESGTGKEVLARAIHRMSPRSERASPPSTAPPFPSTCSRASCSATCAGAFTGATADRAGLFELAHGGTLLLDEIGDLPLDLQAKLLRVLEEGEIRRVGGREPKQGRRAGARRHGQAARAGGRARRVPRRPYYRLNVVRLHLPPLRERPEDMPGAARPISPGRPPQRLGHPVSITPSALDALTHHTWPGNVRELRNAVERAAVLGTGGPLEPHDFALATERERQRHGASHGNGGPPATGGSLELKTQVEAVERHAIQRALEASGGNRRQAASLLGISLRTLFYKMRRLPLH